MPLFIIFIAIAIRQYHVHQRCHKLGAISKFHSKPVKNHCHQHEFCSGCFVKNVKKKNVKYPGMQALAPSHSERLQSPSISSSLSHYGFSRCQNLLNQTSLNFEPCFLGDGDKVNCGECHHYVYRLCLWNLEFIFLYFNFHCFALFVISSVGARIHPWVGRLLCSA